MTKAAGRTSRPSLTRSSIVAAATDLIEREGIEAFTMRSLGRELGASAMAVYSHFNSRDEILVAVLERLMASMDTDPLPGEQWDDTLRRTMTSIYRVEMAHPELASIEVAPEAGERGLAEHTEKIVSLHLAQGMPEPVLRQAWALVDAYLTGFIGNSLAIARMMGPMAPDATPRGASQQASADEGGPEGDAQRGALWQSIVADAYTEEAFAHGVEIIIQGIRALAAPDPCQWRTPGP